MPFKKCSTHDEFAQELANLRGYIRPEDFKAAVMSSIVLGINLVGVFADSGDVVQKWASGTKVPKSLLRSRVILYLKDHVTPVEAASS